MRKLIIIFLAYLFPILLFADGPVFVWVKVNGKLTAKRVTFAGLTYPTTDGTNGQVIVTDGSGNLSFASALTGVGYWTLNTGYLYPSILSNKVGIGTTTPARALHVYDGYGNYPARFSGLAQCHVELNANGYDQSGFRFGTGAKAMWYLDWYGNDASRRFRIRDSTATEILTILSGGYLGLNKTAPNVELYIGDSGIDGDTKSRIVSAATDRGEIIIGDLSQASNSKFWAIHSSDSNLRISPFDDAYSRASYNMTLKRSTSLQFRGDGTTSDSLLVTSGWIKSKLDTVREVTTFFLDQPDSVESDTLWFLHNIIGKTLTIEKIAVRSDLDSVNFIFVYTGEGGTGSGRTDSVATITQGGSMWYGSSTSFDASTISDNSQLGFVKISENCSFVAITVRTRYLKGI